MIALHKSEYCLNLAPHDSMLRYYSVVVSLQFHNPYCRLALHPHLGHTNIKSEVDLRFWEWSLSQNCGSQVIPGEMGLEATAQAATILSLWLSTLILDPYPLNVTRPGL